MNEQPESPEVKAEYIPTQEQIREVLSRFVPDLEKYQLGEVKSDADGIYSLEMRVPANEKGEVKEYQYLRKGRFGLNSSLSGSHICVNYFKGEDLTFSDMVAIYDHDKGEWKDRR